MAKARESIFIQDMINELSKLSRETKGASFTIQHNKDTGQFKVVFQNIYTAAAKALQYTSFERAISMAIDFLKNERVPMPNEFKYTLMKNKS